jgi:hypothetical protein
VSLLHSAPSGPDHIDIKIFVLRLHGQLFRSNVRFRMPTDTNSRKRFLSRYHSSLRVSRADTGDFAARLRQTSPRVATTATEHAALKSLLVAKPNANRRILPQYVLRRTPTGLVDLTPIPFGQRTKAWRTDWANFHLLRDPGSRYPNVRVALAFLRWRVLNPLRASERRSCDDRDYQ